MQLNRCPVCHNRIALEALVQDEAGRELMGLLVSMNTETGAAVVGYLGLFRSPGRDLANSKALKLARDALALGALEQVTEAMRMTVENLSGKASSPLSNHNYLKKVVADVVNKEPAQPCVTVKRVPTSLQSKTAQALQAIEDFIHE